MMRVQPSIVWQMMRVQPSIVRQNILWFQWHRYQSNGVDQLVVLSIIATLANFSMRVIFVIGTIITLLVLFLMVQSIVSLAYRQLLVGTIVSGW